MMKMKSLFTRKTKQIHTPCYHDSSLIHGRKATGTCLFGYIFGYERYRPEISVVSISEDTLEAELKKNAREGKVYLFNCDADECQAFLSKLVKLCDRLNPRELFVLNDPSSSKFNFEKYAYEFPGHSGTRVHIYLYLCSLDRVCIHLLAKLRCNGYIPVLSYGTRIVSFENEQDMIDCFTSLNLERLDQVELVIPGHCSKVLLEQTKRDQRWWRDEHDEAFEKDYLYLDNEGKLGELRGLDSTAADKREYQKRLDKYGKMATGVELHFYIQPTAVQIPLSSSNNVKNHSQKAFQVQVNVESRRDLSAITLLALQVPTLRSIAIEGGSLFVRQQKLIKFMRDSPSKNSRSMDMTMYQLRNALGSRNQPCLYVSDELLDIFNERKLVRMKIYLRSKGSYYLLDKVVDTISKSIYLQKLEFEMKPTHDREDWVRICDFMGKLVKVVPTLTRPLERIDFKFRGFYNFAFIANAEESVRRMKMIMSAMEDKNLQILDVLVGATMFEPRTNCPVAMLPADVFWELKTFLVPSEMCHDKYQLHGYRFV